MATLNVIGYSRSAAKRVLSQEEVSLALATALAESHPSERIRARASKLLALRAAKVRRQHAARKAAATRKARIAANTIATAERATPPERWAV